MPSVRQSEERASGISGGQPALHQAICFLRRPPLPQHTDPRYRRGAEAGLAHRKKELDKQYMRAQLEKMPTPAPMVIGIDEISVRKGHDYRIVVSDLVRGRAIWFDGTDH